MPLAFLFVLCLTDVIAAAAMLATDYNTGIGIVMIVAGCLVSFAGLLYAAQVQVWPQGRSRCAGRTASRR
ncbi:hypothetical protein [Cohnella nanjingensis]|uniref:Uncharacterized protein n=1 Tax=Cohnella nanjingensis TaxID=1387779 RepID=A0A7X0VIA5_9BACL|nr:hypothetical protein [Cohnella nanjingensis]MBB6674756.1 hypothetical protein [Cohnella nanjingensis]